MARRTAARRSKANQRRPYRKAPRQRRRAKRRRFQSLLPTSQQAVERLSALRLPPLSAPSIDWLHWSGWYWNKVVGFAVTCLALAGIFWLHMDTHWFVYADTVEFEAISYLTPEELYPEAELEGWSVFWLRSEKIRELIVAHPYVSDADVRIHLPNRVEIDVHEEQPSAIWMTDTGPMWVLDDGAALEIRTSPNQPIEAQLLDAEGEPLPTIVDVQRGAVSVQTEHLAVDTNVLESALTLIAEMSGLESVRYNHGIGLNFALPGTDYWVYWGDGRGLETKMENLALILSLLESGEAAGQVLDVRYVDHPIIR